MALRRHVVPFLLGTLVLILPAAAHTATLPSGFQETVVFSGLTKPDGRALLARRPGVRRREERPDQGLRQPHRHDADRVRRPAHATSTTSGTAACSASPSTRTSRRIRTSTSSTPTTPRSAGSAPRWGIAGHPLGSPARRRRARPATAASSRGRLSRLQAAGNVMTGAEQVLIEDWCQQYPSHSIGSLAFGADGALYVSGGDGASFNFADWGQDGSPRQPVRRPAGRRRRHADAARRPRAARCAARTCGRRATRPALDGAILRVDPGDRCRRCPTTRSRPAPTRTRAGSSPTACAIRSASRHGRGTNEVWVGDVGWNDWEEIDRLVDAGRRAGRELRLAVLRGRRPPGRLRRRQPRTSARTCTPPAPRRSRPRTTPTTTAPRSCRATTLPDRQLVGRPASRSTAAAPTRRRTTARSSSPTTRATASGRCRRARTAFPTRRRDRRSPPAPPNPVDLQIGPDGDLFYVDFDGGTIRRIRYFSANQPPVAVATANPTTAPRRLTVKFDGTRLERSRRRRHAHLRVGPRRRRRLRRLDRGAADLHVHHSRATYTATLRVTDAAGASSVSDPVTISVGNTPPTATIDDARRAGTTWKVGDSINFSGHATDPQQGTLPASARSSWSLVMQHCPSNCHEHTLQTFSGVASGTFIAPDHEYPSYLELRADRDRRGRS